MDSSNKILTVMDVLDLEESLIDEKLKVIMKRNSISNQHLISAIELLKYKQLINVKEKAECDNDEEYDFVVNLIKKLQQQNVDYVCEIVKIVLSLNVSSMVSKAEHLLQQLLLHIDLKLSLDNEKDICEELETIAYLKLCDSILDSIVENGQKINYIFFDVPLENILQCQNVSFKAHFFIHTVQKMYNAIIDCNILDTIWNYLILETNHKDNALNILCQLSDFYLPIPDYNNKMRFESKVVSQYQFWNILQFGLMSNSSQSRKSAVYLAKKAIDSTLHMKDNVSVTSDNIVIFKWDYKNANTLKSIWSSYFVLIESLEEKQSTIVIPSLKLFEQINCIPEYWWKCLFKLGLKHDNLQVRFNCVKHRVKKDIDSETDALLLLNALNDLYVFNEEYETEIKQEMLKLTDNHKSLTNILKTIKQIKWSPVPLYHITNILASSDLSKFDSSFISETIVCLLNTPCNHIVIRKASYKNILATLANNREWVEYYDYLDIINAICKNDILNYSEVKNCKLYNDVTKVKTLKMENSNDNIIDLIASSHKYIGFGLLYLKNYPEDMEIFLNKITMKFIRINDIIKRQYCDRKECLYDFLFVLNLRKQIISSDGEFNEILNTFSNGYQVLWQYIFALLSSNCILNTEDIICIWSGLKSLNYYNDDNDKNVLLDLNKMCFSLLREKNMDINNHVLCVCLMSIIISNVTFKEHYSQEIPDLNEFLKILTNIQFNQNVSKEHVGRIRSTFYERSCELILTKVMYEDKEMKRNLKELIEFVEKVIDSGGYGCLQWILKIVNKILPAILTNENDMSLNFNTIQFINRMWKEIDELKFNSQYSICIKEFAILITQDCLLEISSYHNIILLYCNKIIEQGSLRKSPLYFLISEINTKQITLNLGPLVYVIGEILLFSPILRKDQRITDKLSLRILNNSHCGIDKVRNEIHFNFDIEYIIMETVSKISKTDVLNSLSNFIMKKINDEFNNKTRYHCNSLAHNVLLKALQHLLFMLLLEEKSIDLQCLCQWSFKLLNKLPHQPNVRICLEWFIALSHVLQKAVINKGLLEKFEKEGIPITSQFHILYWMLKHKIKNETFGIEEYEFVMDTLMSHTMRQIFNTRLNAQYFAVQIYKIINKPDKYGYTINIIKNNFSENDTEKNYIKLQKDYFANDFDIIGDLTPCFIYYALPKYSESRTYQVVDKNSFNRYLDVLNRKINVYCNNYLLEVGWKKYRKQDVEILKLNWNTNLEFTKIQDNIDINTIQKKYIPWRNMLDVEMYQDESKMKEKLSKLIVVVSLIDKLPNLGGMARTSEIFGVKTYVVDSLRHLQDKQFQSVSVSAERWLDVEEIRPGSSLKKYLIAKKSEGYSIVAAEQTSTSIQLQSFKFPEKTLILLGHEREGIPCDLLPLMDYCVEIPQQGLVRSLNVHVTASIFIWEYSRQNML